MEQGKVGSRRRPWSRQVFILMTMMAGMMILSACADEGLRPGTTNSVLLEHMGSEHHRDHGR